MPTRTPGPVPTKAHLMAMPTRTPGFLMARTPGPPTGYVQSSTTPGPLLATSLYSSTPTAGAHYDSSPPTSRFPILAILLVSQALLLARIQGPLLFVPFSTWGPPPRPLLALLLGLQPLLAVPMDTVTVCRAVQSVELCLLGPWRAVIWSCDAGFPSQLRRHRRDGKHPANHVAVARAVLIHPSPDWSPKWMLGFVTSHWPNLNLHRCHSLSDLVVSCIFIKLPVRLP